MTKQTEEKAIEQAAKPKAHQKPPKKEEKQQTKAPAEATIYIGPALQGGRLARYTIFKGGKLPPNVAKLADDHKAIKRLIVPVSKLAESEARLKDKASAEAALFVEAGKIFSKGGK